MIRSKYDYSNTIIFVNREAASREFSATELAMEGYRASPLRPPPGAKLANVADLPFHNFEPSAELLKTPGYNLGGKLLKILKLKKKNSSSTTTTHFLAMEEEFQPSMQTFHFQDLITHSTQFPTPTIEDVRKRYNYDSEEHSDNSNNCSSASIASFSRNSSSSAQSFDSNRSSGTPQSPFLSSCQLSNTQMMANVLMSIMDAADITTTTTTSEELASSEDENPASPPDFANDEIFENAPRVWERRDSKLNGPHESAWHEPRDEFLVESPIARRRHSSASTKHGSGRLTPKARGRSSVDGRLMSPAPSRRFGKSDLSRIEATRFRLRD